jgi:hypothetical protein
MNFFLILRKLDNICSNVLLLLLQIKNKQFNPGIIHNVNTIQYGIIWIV